MTHERCSLYGKELADAAARLASEKKAGDIVILDLKGMSAPADWFVICTSENPIHGRAIAFNIFGGLKREGIYPAHTEGEDSGRWIVIDYFEVVAHIMIKEVRLYYALERLWSGEDEPAVVAAPPPWAARQRSWSQRTRQNLFVSTRRRRQAWPDGVVE